MTGIVAFSQFAKWLELVGPLQETETKQFENRYQAFVNALTRSQQNPTPKDRAVAFGQKYHVVFSHDDPFKETLISHTRAFREMFPDLKLEKQGYGYLFTHRNANPFELQWKQIGEFVESSPRTIEKKLHDLILWGADFDTVLPQLLALLSTDKEISSQAAGNVLSRMGPRCYKLFMLYGYKPQPADFFNLMRMDFEKKAAMLKELVALGVPLDPKIAEFTYDDIKSYELLLNCGHKPSDHDLQAFAKKYDTRKLLPILELMKKHGYVVSEAGCVAILCSHFNALDKCYAQSLAHYNPNLSSRLIELIGSNSNISWRYGGPIYSLAETQQLIQELCSDPKLKSSLFFKFFYSFLATGYQPTLDDFKLAVKAKDKSLIYIMVKARTTQLTQEELFCILSLSGYTSDLLAGQYTCSQKCIREAIDANVNLELIIKDEHRYDNRAQYRAWGKYSLESSDLDYAFPRVSAETFAFLLHCWTYQPQKRWIKPVFEMEDFRRNAFLMEFIEAQYFFRSEELQMACELKCPVSTISILLNHGYKGIVDSREYDYRGMMTERCHSEFRTSNAGYSPSQEDLDFARKAGCSQDVLDLIATHMQRAIS